MKLRRGLMVAVVAWVLWAALALAAPAGSAPARAWPPAGDQALAEAYAPVLYFHPDEVFRPQSVAVMLDAARLQRERRFWFDERVLRQVSPADLLRYRDEGYALDLWYGDDGGSDYKNYSAHRANYEARFSPEAGGPPVVAYAHVVRDEDPAHITLQYWLFYYYNDAFNKHEGDWEMVQVVLSVAGEPEWVILSQHHGGTRRAWEAAPVEDGTHPAVYVSLGSHANYFQGDEVYPHGRTVGNARVEVMDRTGRQGRTVPAIVLIPDVAAVDADPAAWPGWEWLLFRGGWGEHGAHSDFSGPAGPAYKGEQWERPTAWGMAQPLDTEAWYANRLRVEVLGEAAESADVSIRAAGPAPLSLAETLGGLLLLHTDPDPNQVIQVEIQVPPDLPCDILAAWPDREAARVIQYRFDDVQMTGTGRGTLRLQAGTAPTLDLVGSPRRVWPTTMETLEASWDAPDLVWAAAALPAGEVVQGVLVSLAAGLLPTLLFVLALYWADRYEKEPARLLAAAFLWGAVPALLVALVVRLLFRLPVDLLGPNALEAVRAGVLSPLLEEALKGAAVLLIAWRYRLEFDNVLDGIIYGAMAGFGFTMTGNTLSYLGAFAQYGFAALGSAMFFQGFLYGLDHALYTAIFGAGLGYARLARRRWQRWAVPLLAFLAAVVCHALHTLGLRQSVGWTVLTLALTWAAGGAVVGMMVWCLRRQRRCLATELLGEVPDALRQTLIAPRARLGAQWRAFWRGGVRGLARVRHTYQLCAELAFKKMQRRRRPDEPRVQEEVQRLRRELLALLGEAEAAPAG